MRLLSHYFTPNACSAPRAVFLCMPKWLLAFGLLTVVQGTPVVASEVTADVTAEVAAEKTTVTMAESSEVTMAESSERLNAGQRLEAIKQALIELSIGREMTLASSGFIDERGVLHASSLVTSQSNVRGVRVVSYLEEAGVSVAKLKVDLQSDSACDDSRPGLRREVLITDGLIAKDTRLGDYYLSEISDKAGQALTEVLNQSDGWSAELTGPKLGGYQSIALGRSSKPPYAIEANLRQSTLREGQQHGWDFALRYTRLKASQARDWAASKLSLLAVDSPWPAAILAYDLQLVDAVTRAPIASATKFIEFPRLARGYDKSPLPESFNQQLQAIAAEFVAEANEVLSCRPHYYHVNRVPLVNYQLTINAGVVAGVTMGDQFLLSRTPDIIGKGSDITAVSELLLAEVTAVNQHSAIINIIAGLPADSAGSLDRQYSQYIAVYF